MGQFWKYNIYGMSPYKKVHIIIKANKFYTNPRRNALKSIYHYIHVTLISYQKLGKHDFRGIPKESQIPLPYLAKYKEYIQTLWI